MKPRIQNPALLLPDALEAIRALQKVIGKADVPRATLELVNLRASQINGCSVCVDIHTRALKKLGENEQRVLCVSAWRDTPYYSDAERAALALGECTSRLSDRPDPVPDEVWKEAARHYDERQLAALVLSIGVINLFNRVNVATGQPSGDFVEQIVDHTY